VIRESILGNRGNNLLVEILMERYPYLCGDEEIKTLWDFLAMQANAQNEMIANLPLTQKIPLLEECRSFPSDIGQSEMSNSDKRTLLILLVFDQYEFV